jgi:uncharacterized membrane protein YfcA
MKSLTSVLLGVLLLFGIAYVAFSKRPETRTERQPYLRPVMETAEREERKTVNVDGKDVEVAVKVHDQTARLERAEIVTEIKPTDLEVLRFWFLVGIGVLYGAYMLLVLILWARDKVWLQPRSQHSTDTAKRMDGIVTFCTGVLIGFIGGLDLAAKPTPGPTGHTASVSSLEHRSAL